MLECVTKFTKEYTENPQNNWERKSPETTQWAFCSRIPGGEREMSERASVTYEVQGAKPRLARASKDDACATFVSWLRLLHSHALAFFLTQTYCWQSALIKAQWSKTNQFDCLLVIYFIEKKNYTAFQALLVFLNNLSLNSFEYRVTQTSCITKLGYNLRPEWSSTATGGSDHCQSNKNWITYKLKMTQLNPFVTAEFNLSPKEICQFNLKQWALLLSNVFVMLSSSILTISNHLHIETLAPVIVLLLCLTNTRQYPLKTSAHHTREPHTSARYTHAAPNAN